MNLRLSDTEKKVTEYIWSQNGEVRICDLYSYMKKGDWARQTLNTLLIRLEVKGIVDRSKRGYVRTTMTQEEYVSSVCKEFVEKYVNLKNLIECYYYGEAISHEEADDLINVINSVTDK